MFALLSSRSCRPWVAALLACTAFIGGSLRAQPVLTLDAALQLAQDRSRQLVAQGAAGTAAREMAVAAGQRPDPTLRLGLDNLPIDGPDRFSVGRDFMTMRSVGIALELTRADKLAARAARFAREADAADAAGTLALASLRRDTALAWLDRYHQEQLRDLLRAQRREAGLQIDAADTAYRSARGTQADVFAARSAVAAIDERLLQAEQLIAAATTRLARWVGAEGARPLGTPPVLTALRADAVDVEALVLHHPEIALMASREAMAAAEAELVRRNQRADWSVELTLSQRGSSYSNMASVNLSVPLQLGRPLRQDRELAAKLATVDQMRSLREEATREHLAETRGWVQAWQGDRARLGLYDSSLIPLAAERTRAALAAYRGAAGPLAAVLEARRAEIDTRIERLRLEMDAAARWAQLEYLVVPGHTAASAKAQ